MKKILLTLALILLFPSAAFAQETPSLSASCGSGNRALLTASWNIRGSQCNVFIEAAGSVDSTGAIPTGAIPISSNCSGPQTFQGTITTRTGGQTEIKSGGSYRLCAGSDTQANICSNTVTPSCGQTDTTTSTTTQAAGSSSIDSVFGKIRPPIEIQPLSNRGGAGGLSFFIGLLLELMFIFAGIAFLLIFVFNAFQWIISGGDKEKIANARKAIVNAIIGLSLLALARFIIALLGQILNIDLLKL